MKRRSLLPLLNLSLLFPSWVHGQSRNGTARIGILITGAAPHPLEKELPKELSALGYKDGQLSFDTRYAERRINLSHAHAKELVGSSVDLIVAHFTPAAKAAKDATNTIPIVMAAVGAPVESGLIESFARPGANVTGTTNVSSELAGRRLQILRELVPGVTKLAFVSNATDPFVAINLKQMRDATQRVAIELEHFEVKDQTVADPGLAPLLTRGFHAVMVSGLSPVVLKQLFELANKQKIPVVGFERELVVQGALFCITASQAEIFRRTAWYVDRILKGAKPADLPIEQPAMFELTLNAQVAQQLGIAIPVSVLVSVDELIE